MPEYRIRETGQVVTESEFRAIHSTRSFPYQITVEILDDLGADPVFEGPWPTATKYQVVYRDGVVQDEEGRWFTNYAIADMTDEAKAAVDEAFAQNNRIHKNQLLTDSDWTQLSDVPLTADCKSNFIAWRQQLRERDMYDTESEWPVRPAEEWEPR